MSLSIRPAGQHANGFESVKHITLPQTTKLAFCSIATTASTADIITSVSASFTTNITFESICDAMKIKYCSSVSFK